MESTHYSILSLKLNANLKEITQSYSQLAKECHTNKDRLVLINTAYQVLSNPITKAAYDYSLSLINGLAVEYTQSIDTDHITTIINRIQHFKHITEALKTIKPILNSIKFSNDNSNYIGFSSNVGLKLMNIVINDINKLPPTTSTITDIDEYQLVSACTTITIILNNIDLDDDTKAACTKYLMNIDEIINNYSKFLISKKIISISTVCGIVITILFFSFFLLYNIQSIDFFGVFFLFIYSCFIYILSKIIIRLILQLIWSIFIR